MSVQIIKEKVSLVTKELINYAKTTIVPGHRLDVSLNEIQSCNVILNINSGDVHFKTPEQLKTMVKNTLIVYKV